MLFKAWTKIFLLTSISFFLIIISLNFIVNPYHIFNDTLFSKYFPQKNYQVSTRMASFYIAKHSQPKNLMMGSSRIEMFPKTDLNKYLKTSIYNLAMSGANIEEQTQYIMYMIKNHDIQNIVWALDFFAFNPDRANDPTFSYNRLSTTLIKDDYKVALLSLQTSKNSLKTIQDNIDYSKNKTVQKPLYLIKKEFNKQYTLLSKRTIDKQTEQTLDYYKRKMLKNKNFDNPKSILPNIKKVNSIIDLCHKNHIKLYIYLSPVQESMLNLYTKLGLLHTFKFWKKSLQDITSYTDFCTKNSVTVNKYNFIDGAHIMPQFSNLIFAKVFHDTTIDIPSDFGTYIKQSKLK